jgi:hypothetical protein
LCLPTFRRAAEGGIPAFWAPKRYFFLESGWPPEARPLGGRQIPLKIWTPALTCLGSVLFLNTQHAQSRRGSWLSYS